MWVKKWERLILMAITHTVASSRKVTSVSSGLSAYLNGTNVYITNTGLKSGKSGYVNVSYKTGLNRATTISRNIRIVGK